MLTKWIGISVGILLLLGVLGYELKFFRGAQQNGSKAITSQVVAGKEIIKKSYSEYDNKIVTGEKAMQLLQVGEVKDIRLYFRTKTSAGSFCLTSGKARQCRTFDWSSMTESDVPTNSSSISNSRSPTHHNYVHPQALFHSTPILNSSGEFVGVAFQMK